MVSELLCNRPAVMVAGASGCLWPPVRAERRDEGLLGEGGEGLLGEGGEGLLGEGGRRGCWVSLREEEDEGSLGDEGRGADR